MTWYLDNICKRNKKSPYLFYVPSEQEIDSLKLKLGKVIFFVTEAEEDAYCRGGSIGRNYAQKWTAIHWKI
ncbi:hypothetical protein [Bacillus paranthracis]|uniref:hypothetical protein n=1 Tax=Bacillus paranthracis TaxID=2026186 RepID=UPI001BB0A7DE|nr:hypothetical protein [Bacillus paranthracis]